MAAGQNAPRPQRRPRPRRRREPDGSKPATVTADSEAARGATMIEVSDLTVRFGGVTPLDGMTVKFEIGHLRADRAQRGRQDDLLQRPQRLRQAGRRHRHGVRRGPAHDGPLPACALGRPAHVPDRAGDRGAVGLRQRRARPRALEGRGRVAPRATCCEAIAFVGLEVDPDATVGTLGARDRRLVEVARAVVGQPTRRAARRARRRPARRGDRPPRRGDQRGSRSTATRW